MSEPALKRRQKRRAIAIPPVLSLCPSMGGAAALDPPDVDHGSGADQHHVHPGRATNGQFVVAEASLDGPNGRFDGRAKVAALFVIGSAALPANCGVYVALAETQDHAVLLTAQGRSVDSGSATLRQPGYVPSLRLAGFHGHGMAMGTGYGRGPAISAQVVLEVG